MVVFCQLFVQFRVVCLFLEPSSVQSSFQVSRSGFLHRPLMDTILHQRRNTNACFIGERILSACVTLHTTTSAGAWLSCLVYNRGLPPSMLYLVSVLSTGCIVWVQFPRLFKQSVITYISHNGDVDRHKLDIGAGHELDIGSGKNWTMTRLGK